jgi:virulence-associated protein VapD
MSVAWKVGAWATNSWVGMNAGPPNAWWGSATVVRQSGGGGGYPNKHHLPQYYSRRVLDERVSLPQDAIANPIAISVLDDARELESRLAKNNRDFTEMLEQTDHMLKQAAVYIESQQIYNIIRTVEMKIKARRDAEIAVLAKMMRDEEEELNELLDLI